MKSPLRSLILSACAIALPLLAGCGGGASEDTTITIKSDKSLPADSGGPAAPGGKAPATTDGGTPAATGGFGHWKGRVVFKGTKPNLPALVKMGDPSVKDAAVCAAEAVPNEAMVPPSGDGVGNVFIYLRSAPAGAKVAPATENPKFDQRGCEFRPHALVCRTNVPVMVVSDDPIAHNTHTQPKRNQPFNQVIKANDRTGAPLLYTRPENEPVRVICDFHPWMLAYHLPLDHPFVALSSVEDGSFEIRDLPAGKHRFSVWHEGVNGGYLSRSYEVTITADQTLEQDIEYDAGKFTANADNGAATVKLSSLSN